MIFFFPFILTVCGRRAECPTVCGGVLRVRDLPLTPSSFLVKFNEIALLRCRTKVEQNMKTIIFLFIGLMAIGRAQAWLPTLQRAKQPQHFARCCRLPCLRPTNSQDHLHKDARRDLMKGVVVAGLSLVEPKFVDAAVDFVAPYRGALKAPATEINGKTLDESVECRVSSEPVLKRRA